MKKKIVYVSLVGILLIFTGTGSFLLGKEKNELNALPKTGTQSSTSSAVPMTASAEEGLESKTIAVVNLDEGINKNGRVVNYASEISRYPSEDFYSTGLEDAKRGLLTGDYGAYVVIPATFSENVESLNVKIQKAQITYSVSNQLKDSVKLDVKDEINEYTKRLNQSISYLYVDSILSEFQGTQSTISTVLLNNNQGNEALGLVEPADLLNFMNIPELKQPDAFVEAIDIEEEMTKNSEVLEGMLADYQSGLTTGQEAAEEIVVGGNSLTENASASFAEVGNTAIGKDSNGGFKYANEAQKTANDLGTYLKGSADWFDAITKTVAEKGPDIQAALLSAQYYYEDDASGVSPYETQITNLADFYGNLQIKPAMSTMRYTTDVPIASLSSDGTQLILTSRDGVQVGAIPLHQRQVSGGPGQGPGQVVSLEEGETEVPETETVPPAPQYEYVLDTSEVIDLINSLSPVTELSISQEPDVTITDSSDNPVNLSDSTIISSHFPDYAAFGFVKDEVNNIMIADTAVDGSLNRLTASLTGVQGLADLDLTSENNPLNQTTRDTEVNKIQTDLKTNVVDPIEVETNQLNDNLKGKSADLSSQASDFTQLVNRFDPFSFLDQAALQGGFGSVQENNSSISGKTATHISKMSENLLDTYMVYTENQMNLLEEAQNATDKGTDKVTEGLSSAKETLSELMDENYSLLQPITTKLSYTKVGEVADQTVYQHIVSPLTVSNQSDDNKVTPAERRTKDTEQQVVAQANIEKKSNGNNLIVPFVGGFLLLALVALGIIIVLSKNRKNDQKW